MCVYRQSSNNCRPLHIPEIKNTSKKQCSRATCHKSIEFNGKYGTFYLFSLEPIEKNSTVYRLRLLSTAWLSSPSPCRSVPFGLHKKKGNWTKKTGGKNIFMYATDIFHLVQDEILRLCRVVIPLKPYRKLRTCLILPGIGQP